MNRYAVFFDYNNKTYRLPVNPEEIETSSIQAIEKYEILKLGQIAIPTHMQLKEYSFETEFPKYTSNKNYRPFYIETPNEYHGSDYYLSLFENLRKKLVPIRFIAGRYIDSDDDKEIDEGEIDLNKSINTLVLIEDMTITEKAGEEGDKYVKFKLLEYRDYSIKIANEITYTLSVDGTYTLKKQNSAKTEAASPKSPDYYVVQAGDSLWSIAKKLYGDGSKYNIIFNANKDKIKNPGLISTGWKLKIPAVSDFVKYSTPSNNPTAYEARTTAGKTNATQTAYEQAVDEISRGAGRVRGAGRIHGAGRIRGAGRDLSYDGSGGAGRDDGHSTGSGGF